MKTPNKVAILFQRFIQQKLITVLAQITSLFRFCVGLIILVGLYVIAQYVSEFYALSMPPAILGIAALFIFFIVVQRVPKSIRLAGQPLLTHMSLFFIPAIVAIINYLDLIKAFPLALLLAVVITTLISLAITAWIAQHLMHALNPQTKHSANHSQSTSID